MALNKKIIRENGRINLGLTCADFYVKVKKDRKRIRVNETEARKIVKEEGLRPGKTIEKQTLDNKAGITESVFVFEDTESKTKNPNTPAPTIAAKQEAQTKPDSTTSTTRAKKRRGRKPQQNLEKTHKKLDNSAEHVIIEE